MKYYEIPLTEYVFYSGVPSIYEYLFKQMIQEFQTCQIGYEEMLEIHLRQLFLEIQRNRQKHYPVINSFLQEEIDYAKNTFMNIIMKQFVLKNLPIPEI